MTRQDKFGLSVALATPFDSALKVDLENYVQHARRCLDSGCDSVTALGTTGENVSIGIHTRAKMLAALKNGGISGEQLVVGIAACSCDDAITQIALARDAGASRVLLPPPWYFKGVDDNGIYAWYENLFTTSGDNMLPAILYNIPALTGVTLSIDLIARLRENFSAHVVGVKDSSGDWDYTQKLLQTHNDIAILVGDERQLAAAIRGGAQGAICGVANCYPNRMQAIVATGQDNPYISGVVEALCQYSIIPALKALLTHTWNEKHWLSVLPPLNSLDSTQRTALVDSIEALQAEPA
ncbi:MAG: dihydrodipicolinate synthase family protein [Granulosicoccus sp.]